MERNQDPSLQQILGEQVLSLLKQSGITNLRLEIDGSISGEQQVIRGVPQIDSIKNITIGINGEKIVIRGEISESVTDIGKII